MVNIALIGYGYWGVNLLRNLVALKDCNVIAVCESSEKRQQVLKALYPSIQVTADYQDITNNLEIDAVVIATPVHSHFTLAKQALKSGKHVLVEKPLTASTEEAQILIDLATSKNLQLMVDHTFLYSGAVEKIKELVDNDNLGILKYVDSTRINLGLIQSDVNVLWDLAPHDLSILAFITKEEPLAVCATGTSHTGNGIENIAYMTLKYPSGFIAHFNCSWSSPVKVRSTLIGGDKKMIVYDDINPTEKIKVYDSGYVCRTEEDKTKMQVDYRIGDIHIPKVSTHEPLRKMLEDYVSCIQTGNTPTSNWKLALQTVKVLEAAELSLKLKGQEVII